MNKPKLLETLVNTGRFAPVAFLAGCVSIVAGTMNDSDALEAIGTVVLAVAVVAILIGMVAAAAQRKFLVALSGLGGLAACLAMFVLTFILIGAGQHHPPRTDGQAVDDLDWTGFSGDLSDYPFNSLTVERDSMAIAVTLTIDGSATDTLIKPGLAQLVSEQMFPHEDGESTVEGPAFEGHLRAFLDACADKKWEELRDNTFTSAAPADTDDDIPTPEELAQAAAADGTQLSSYQISLSKVFDNEHFVSFSSRYESYVNATPHPNMGFAGITIRKSDGQVMGRNMLRNTSKPAFRQLLKEALRQWAADVLDEKAATDDDLKKVLYGEKASPNAIPLPRQRPYLTAEGVAFPYQEYELTNGSEPPVLTIPYEKMKPYLAISVE